MRCSGVGRHDVPGPYSGVSLPLGSGALLSNEPGFFVGDRLLTTREVATFLDLSPETVLRRWRTFELARYMGTSVEMIERTYGHLVTGADDAFRSRMDSYGKLAEAIDSGRAQ